MDPHCARCSAIVAVLLFATACRTNDNAVPGSEPALANTAVPFVGEQLAQGAEVFRGTFTPDGRGFYFFRKITPGSEDYRIFFTRFERGAWSVPELVGLGGEHSDLYPALSADGRRMVFSSYRRLPGDTSARPNAHLWVAEAADDGWTEPVPLETVILRGHYHSGPEFDRAGNLIFRRITPDWRTRHTLIARRNGRDFLAPEPYPLFEQVRRQYPELALQGASPGPGDTVLFLDIATRDSVTGRGASDIWFTRRDARGWSAPRPMVGAVNSPGFDVFPMVSPDQRELFFVRDFRLFYRVSLAAAIGSEPSR